MNSLTKKLSPGIWDLLAAVSIVMTFYQTALMISLHPAPLFCRFAFVLTGVIGIVCVRHSPYLAKLLAWFRDRAFYTLGWSFCLLLFVAMICPLFAKARARSHVYSDHSKLKIISLAFKAYAQDYDGLLPPPGSQRELRNVLSSHMNYNQMVWRTYRNDYFVVNNAVMGSSLRSFSDLGSSVVLAYAPTLQKRPKDVPYRIVSFLDFRVDDIPETRFDWLLLQSKTTAAKLAMSSAQKTASNPKDGTR